MQSDFGNALSVILYFVDDEYRKSHRNITDMNDIKIDSENVLQAATENKLSYYYIKRILEERSDLNTQKLKTLMTLEEKRLTKAKETLAFLISLLNDTELDFLVLKTHKNLPYSTLDIDILVKDFQESANVLEKGGLSGADGPFFNVLLKLDLGYPSYRAEGLLNIDLYTDVPWSGLQSMDNEFLWENPRSISIYGVECPIPNIEADLLSIVSTSLFTDRKFTLLDFLYMESLLEGKLNLDRVIEQTKKYGWREQFVKVISILRNIKRLMYESEKVPSNIRFPYTLPMSILLESLQGPINHMSVKNAKSFPFALAKASFHCILGHIYVDIVSLMHNMNPSNIFHDSSKLIICNSL